MKSLILLAAFLISAQAAFATNITVGNLTIMVPDIKINVSALPSMQLPDQTYKIEPIRIVTDIGISDLLKDQLGKIYEVVADVLSISVKRSLEQLPTLVDLLKNGSNTC